MNALVQREAGLALLAVLWIVAAISLIVSGVVHSVRNEIKVVSGMQDTVVADAFGVAVINLALQELALKSDQISRLTTVPVSYQGLSLPVQVQPLNGLIDINHAEPPLLISLFAVAGGVPPGAAAELATAVVGFRQQRDARGLTRGFEAIEDLLQVPGVSYPLYARLAGLVTSELRGSGRVNAMAAPLGVLLVLANGDLQGAQRLAAARDSGGPLVVDASSLNAALVDNAPSRRLRLTARVPLSGGGWLVSSRVVDLAEVTRLGLPWRILGTERHLEKASGPNRLN